MEKYKEITIKLREEILSLRKLDYPQELTNQKNDILSQLIKLSYSTIDSACAILQGSTEFVEQFPSKQLRQAIEQNYPSSLTTLNATEAVKNLLAKIDEVSNMTRDLLSYADRYVGLASQTSLLELTETVYKAQGQLEAESMHLFLESYGFPNKVLQESAGIVLALTVGKLGEAEIRVAPEDADQARRYIQAMEDGIFMLSDLEEAEIESIFPEADEPGDLDD